MTGGLVSQMHALLLVGDVLVTIRLMWHERRSGKKSARLVFGVELTNSQRDGDVVVSAFCSCPVWRDVLLWWLLLLLNWPSSS